MPVQTDINSLSTTPSSNSPTGGESANLVDDYLRQASAHIAALRDSKQSPHTTQAVTTSTSIGGWGRIVTVSSTSPVTLTLPSATAADVGKTIIVRNGNTGSVTVNEASGTFNYDTSQNVLAYFQAIEVQCIGVDNVVLVNRLLLSFPLDGSAAMAGVLRVLDGSPSTPGLAFADATTTGFYRSGTTVSVGIAGTERLSISGDATFQIKPDALGTARLQVPDGSKIQLGAGSGSGLFIDSDQKVYLGAANNSPPVGYLGAPRHLNFGGTIARTAVGKVVCDTPTVNYTLNTGVFSAGDSFWILHYGSGYAIQVIQGSGMSILLGGNGGAAGTRNLASNCLAFVHFKSSTECVISGVGVS